MPYAGWLTKTQQSQVFYDESQFHTDRTEVSHNQGQSCKPPRQSCMHAHHWHVLSMSKGWANSCPKAFTVHPPDTLKPNVFNDTAPSRPPSRVSTRGNDIGENVYFESSSMKLG